MEQNIGMYKLSQNDLFAVCNLIFFLKTTLVYVRNESIYKINCVLSFRAYKYIIEAIWKIHHLNYSKLLGIYSFLNYTFLSLSLSLELELELELC